MPVGRNEVQNSHLVGAGGRPVQALLPRPDHARHRLRQLAGRRRIRARGTLLRSAQQRHRHRNAVTSDHLWWLAGGKERKSDPAPKWARSRSVAAAARPGLDFSTQTEGGGASPVTVEAHLTGLNPGVNYHFRLVATNGAGTEAKAATRNSSRPSPPKRTAPTNSSATKTTPSPCPNAAPTRWSRRPARKALAQAARLRRRRSSRLSREPGTSPNPARISAPMMNNYVADRTATGWETIPNLNGSSGTLRDAPCYVDSDDSALPRPSRRSPHISLGTAPER